MSITIIQMLDSTQGHRQTQKGNTGQPRIKI